ncbi:SpoIIE family protein phosphatase [Streptomyces jeddahensis]|uniref:Phosphoserine phosphatase RsbU n=1 Tax=Streptomyces jeddahensis TaxID=1716141 RepID=A0A177HQI5_9ACTN|nr:SpoIIE family protein phosphatase [Streptomyces jeddahensis]OAH12996.1 phosphoserine phosphatase RsbU [Streptomyces jeddahensis]
MDRRIASDQGTGPLGDVVDEALTARATVDEQATVTGWSVGAEALLGYSAAQIVGRPAVSLLADETTARDLPPLAQLPRWHGRLALRHRDGHRVEAGVLAHHRSPEHASGEWLLLSAVTGRLSQPDDDTLVGWSFAQSPCCAMALYDSRLRLRRANEAMERSVALTEDEMRGLRVPEIVDNEAGELAEQDMLQVLATGEPRYRENYLRAAGETREHAWSVFLAPLWDGEGRLHGVCLSAHDMTEQYWARKRLQVIAEAGKRIGSTLDVMRTAQELADVAVPELADFISVDLLACLDDVHEPQPGAVTASGPLALRRVAHQSVHPGVPEAVVALGGLDEYPEDTPPAASLRQGRALLHQVSEPAIAAWLARDPVRAARVRDFGIHSVMTVPLSARGTTLGVAVLSRYRQRHPDPFGEDDLVLAEELAARAALSIDNARRYTRERSTAVTLQRSLLPQRLPEQAAVEVASRYLPAGAQAGVGGDWFDVIPLSGARVALVVGDVVGHGIHASATMGRLRTAVRTLADIDLLPDELLTHLDDLVARLSTEVGGMERPAREAESGEVGATCLYAVYDPVSRRCTLSRAGHPPPAVVSPDGTVELLDLPAGPPLGLGGLPFEAVEVDLPEGSLLVLYTDGLLASRESDIDAGMSRLRQVLARPAGSLDALCDTVLAAVLPQRPVDDAALLVARTRALKEDHVATWDVAADPAAVAQARKDAVAQLEAWGLGDAVFVTELIVSELVTNAIRHAEPPIQLRLIHDRNLICEVTDASSTAPHMRRARIYDEGGRGLLLVAQLSRHWGTRHAAKGKTIWAEQTLT